MLTRRNALGAMVLPITQSWGLPDVWIDVDAARAFADGDGAYGVEITVKGATSEHLEWLTRQAVGRRLHLVHDGATLTTSRVLAPIENGVILMQGALSRDQAEAIAAQLSRPGARILLRPE